MRLPFFFALFVALGFFNAAYAQQSGSRVCSTTTSGSISHEYCTFTPLVVQVQAPAVNVAPAAVTIQAPPAPKPQAAPVSPAKPKE